MVDSMAENVAIEATRSVGREPVQVTVVPVPTRRPPASPLLRTPQAHAEPQGQGLLDLQLSGCLPPDWSLRLARGLATRSIGLRNGYARRLEGEAWLARLELDHSRSGGPAPDFLALATACAPALASAAPPLLDLELAESADFGGCLHLEVHAWDAIGLLASVLGQVAAASLRAEELILETEGECAFHHLVLKGARGDAPAPAQRRRLRQGLEGLLDGR